MGNCRMTDRQHQHVWMELQYTKNLLHILTPYGKAVCVWNLTTTYWVLWSITERPLWCWHVAYLLASWAVRSHHCDWCKGVQNKLNKAWIQLIQGCQKAPTESQTGSVESESGNPHLFAQLRPSVLSSCEKNDLFEKSSQPSLFWRLLQKSILQFKLGKHGQIMSDALVSTSWCRMTYPGSRRSFVTFYPSFTLKQQIIIKLKYLKIILSDVRWRAFTLYSLRHLLVPACQEFLLPLAFPVRYNRIILMDGQSQTQQDAAGQLADCWVSTESMWGL